MITAGAPALMTRARPRASAWTCPAVRTASLVSASDVDAGPRPTDVVARRTVRSPRAAETSVRVACLVMPPSRTLTVLPFETGA